MAQGYVNDSVPLSVKFPSDKAGLLTVGYTLLNIDGTTDTARATAGVYDLGNGSYATQITKISAFKGIIKWDTGEGSPLYAYEDINITARMDSLASQASVDNIHTDLNSIPAGITVADIETSTILAKEATLTDIHTDIGAIPTNPVLATDVRLDNLDGKISDISVDLTPITSELNILDGKVTDIAATPNIVPANIWGYEDRTLTQPIANQVVEVLSATPVEVIIDADVVADTVWDYPQRILTNTPSVTGIGEFAVTVNVTVDGEISPNHMIYLYKSDKTKYRYAKTSNDGIVVFNVDAGDYYIQAVLEGTWVMDKQISVAGNIETNVGAVSSSEYLTFRTQKLDDRAWVVGESEDLGFKVSSIQRKAFTITSGAYTITTPDGVTSASAATDIDGDTVFIKFNPVVAGKHIIDMAANVANQIVKEIWSITVK